MLDSTIGVRLFSIPLRPDTIQDPDPSLRRLRHIPVGPSKPRLTRLNRPLKLG